MEKIKRIDRYVFVLYLLCTLIAAISAAKIINKNEQKQMGILDSISGAVLNTIGEKAGSSLGDINSQAYEGATYYDSNTGQILQFSNGAWSPMSTTEYSGTQQEVNYDPYASYGGKAAYDASVNSTNTQKNNIMTSAGEAIDASGRSYGSSILDYLESLKSGQRNVDNKTIQNEMSYESGQRAVSDKVGRGVRSANVILANNNAGDSSAVGAVARAYGDIGRRDMANIGNQYELGKNAIMQEQTSLDESAATGARKLDESKVSIINNIVNETRNQLAALDAQIAGASLPNRINIEQEKANIRQQAIDRLQQFDQQLASGRQAVKPIGQEGARQEATRLMSAGTAPTNMFDFSTSAPADFQAGSSETNLPIFVAPRTKRTA